MEFTLILTFALMLDLLLGDPRSLPHPVTGAAKIAGFWEKRLYPGPGTEGGVRLGSLFCLAVVLSVCAAAGGLWLLSGSVGRPVVEVGALYTALAWRSLKDETRPIALALFRDNLEGARKALSRVVGRDTEGLEVPDVVRAAVETVAENSVDGTFSVVFFAALGWLAAGGIGMVLLVWAFKAVSTLDSTVGYRNERYIEFGRASARLDDILNFLPARFGGLVILAAGACLGLPFPEGLKAFLRDRKKHESPNSAHGESAFAGLLGIRLGGGAAYSGVFKARPWLGDASRDPEPEDLFRAHQLLDASAALFVLLMIGLVLGLE